MKIHSLAVLLKQFLMELPNPIVPFSLYKKFLDAYGSDIDTNINTYKELVQLLPPIHLQVLSYILEFLVEISKFKETNLMGFINLGVVFGPSMIRPQVADTFSLMNSTNAKIIELFVEYFDVIFQKQKEPYRKKVKRESTTPTKTKTNVKRRSTRRVKSVEHKASISISQNDALPKNMDLTLNLQNLNLRQTT